MGVLFYCTVLRIHSTIRYTIGAYWGWTRTHIGHRGLENVFTEVDRLYADRDASMHVHAMVGTFMNDHEHDMWWAHADDDTD